jgi:hypothetical protein
VGPILCPSRASLGLESGVEGCNSVTGGGVELTEGACWKVELRVSLVLSREGCCLEFDADSVICSFGGSLGLELAGGDCSSVIGICAELTEGACWKLELRVSLLLCRRGCCLEIDVDSVLCALGGFLGLELAR